MNEVAEAINMLVDTLRRIRRSQLLEKAEDIKFRHDHSTAKPFFRLAEEFEL